MNWFYQLSKDMEDPPAKEDSESSAVPSVLDKFPKMSQLVEGVGALPQTNGSKDPKQRGSARSGRERNSVLARPRQQRNTAQVMYWFLSAAQTTDCTLLSRGTKSLPQQPRLTRLLLSFSLPCSTSSLSLLRKR